MEKAPPGFTDRIMGQIDVQETPETYTDQPFFTRRTWLLLIAASAAVVIILFFIDWSFLGFSFTPEKVDAQQFKNVIPYIQGVIESFGSAFEFLTRSSIPFIVLIGTAALFTLDRILRKIVPKRSYLL